jgi:hypothetical protein
MVTATSSTLSVFRDISRMRNLARRRRLIAARR